MNPTTDRPPIKPALRISVVNRQGSRTELVGVPAEAACRAVTRFRDAARSLRRYVAEIEVGSFERVCGRSWLEGFAGTLDRDAAALETAIGGEA